MQFSRLSRLKQREETISSVLFALWMAVRDSDYIIPVDEQSSMHTTINSAPLAGLPEFSYLGWGHWFTLTDLELATNRFAKDNVLCEGGYGVVYRRRLSNGTPKSVMKIIFFG
ncbi:hypothetical protein SORBI_3005G132100 [Sorghum bicolor]|uniref:Protein kinase domain-containing protein n=1 Tax=Sorghum bicolor TaxID=4558 RepID=A0A1B6PS71_SORBI|nr:hypothetical protein SORBI_3005G132100 [Sorghum bicolor]KXG28520.1 hypothetical protein SORBI_3005G132100 [Sorghum bicolor]